MNPGHIFVAFWLGSWLGILAWRAGSVWPGVVVHAATNALGFTLLLMSGGLEPKNGLHFPMPAWIIGGAALVAGIIILARARPRSAGC